MSDGTLRIAAALVALAGAGVAAYLTAVHYRSGLLVCTTGGGCETVQQSSYAEIAGIPVALLGLIAYSTAFVLVVLRGPAARLAAAAVALGAVIFSAYLLVVQLFVIDAICIWCVVNDVVIAPALAVLTALRLRDTA